MIVKEKIKEDSFGMNDIIPQKVLFNLKAIEELGIAKISMMKKIIYKGEIPIVKIGNKIHVKRSELIKFINSNTISLNQSII